MLLKRGLCATIEEWLMAAEYIVSSGNPAVILCERGIRTFETYTRNTLDLAAVPLLRQLTHLPVVVDPSHATGKRWLVRPMALAAVAAGADGIMVEVHPDPDVALSDGEQSLTLEQFAEMAPVLREVHEEVGGLVGEPVRRSRDWRVGSVAALAAHVGHTQRGRRADAPAPASRDPITSDDDDHRVRQHVQEERRRLVVEERVRDAEEVGRPLEVERQAQDRRDEVGADHRSDRAPLGEDHEGDRDPARARTSSGSRTSRVTRPS